MTDTEGVVLTFFTPWKRMQAIFLSYGVHFIPSAGHNFMGIGLMAHIPNQAVKRSIVDIMQGNGEFDCS